MDNYLRSQEAANTTENAKPPNSNSSTPKTYQNQYPEDGYTSVGSEMPKFNGEKYVNNKGYTMNGTYEYVVTDTGRVRVGSDVGHENLANGNPVTYAGEIKFSKGQIQSWSNRSGHYLPDAAGYGEAIPYLQEAGLSEITSNNFIPAN